MLDLDLNLMCDSYFHATMDHLQTLNQELEVAGAQLVEANAIKDEFLAQVSHDLRTPLNSILSFTKLVLDGLCTNPEEEKEVLRDVFSSGQLLVATRKRSCWTFPVSKQASWPSTLEEHKSTSNSGLDSAFDGRSGSIEKPSPGG